MNAWLSGIVLAACALGAAGSGIGAWSSARGSWRGAFQRQAEDIAAFVGASLDARGDLLVVERFREIMGSRGDVSWILVQDPAGRITFSNSASELGLVLDSPRSKAAGAAARTLVQEGPDPGGIEVDIPLGRHGVLRVAGVPRSLAKTERWIIAGVLFALAGPAAAWALTRTRGRNSNTHRRQVNGG